jgi:hypothetical protein
MTGLSAAIRRIVLLSVHMGPLIENKLRLASHSGGQKTISWLEFGYEIGPRYVQDSPGVAMGAPEGERK